MGTQLSRIVGTEAIDTVCNHAGHFVETMSPHIWTVPMDRTDGNNRYAGHPSLHEIESVAGRMGAGIKIDPIVAKFFF